MNTGHIVTVRLLLDVAASDEACDWVNEALRGMQRTYSAESALIDYQLAGVKEQEFDAANYAEGDMREMLLSPFARAYWKKRREAKAGGESVDMPLPDSVEIGMEYRFAYPEAFVTKPDYSARRGQTVTVVRQLTQEEADQGDGMERMFEIKAADGWVGHAWAGELEPL